MTLRKDLSEDAKKFMDEGMKLASDGTDKVTKLLSGVTQELVPKFDNMINEDGEIPTYRINTASKEVDLIEEDIREIIMEGFEDIIDEAVSNSVDSVVDTFVKYSVSLAVLKGLLSRENISESERAVKEFLMEREINGLTVVDRISGVSSLLISEIRKSVRYGIISKESISKIMKRIKDAINRSVWQIKRIFSSEVATSLRAVISIIGEKLGIIKGVKIIDNRGRHAYHHTHMCYKYAEEDKYGMGKGVYKVSDTYILDPHPQCTAYFEFVFKDNIFSKGEDD